MKKLLIICVALTILFVSSDIVKANAFTAISHKSSYYGTSTRYSNLADAQAGTNAIDTFNTGDVRVDFGIEVDPSDYTYVSSTWFYTTDQDHGEYSGWGNSVANSRTGFLQIYDADNSTMNSMEGHFGDFDGTYYTSFSVNLSGGELDPYSAWGTPSNWNSAANHGRGDFISWSLDLTYSGLQGVKGATEIVSTNHPTDATGEFTGLFVDLNGDYHSILINDFNADAWSYDVQDQLNGAFYDSYFSEAVPVPAPGAFLLGGIGVACVGWIKRRRAL